MLSSRGAGFFGTAMALIVALVLTPSAAGAPDVIYRGSSTTKTIALTFDDGYAPERCREISDILQDHGITATWFPNGVHVRSSPAIWKKIAERDPIANHTLTHASLVGLSKERFRKELLANQRTIERVTGKPMLRLLRPTFGAFDDRVVRAADRLGYRVVMWSLSAADTSPEGTDRGIAKRALSGGPGSIILMHCGPEVTPRILPIVIARYACAGYRFAALDDLLAGRPGVEAQVSCPPPRLPAAQEPRTGRPKADRQDAEPGNYGDAAASPGLPGHGGDDASTAPAPGDDEPAQGQAETGPSRPDIVAYDLGTVTVTQSQMAQTDFELMPVRARGIVALPSGDGPFPVVAVVHGSYPFCDAPLIDGEVDPYPCPPDHDLRQYEGFDELASKLAAHGYLTIVPDLSAEYSNGYGSAPFGERTIKVLDAHLGALASGSGFPADIAAKADLDRLLLVGHSRGGPLIIRYATDGASTRAPRALALLAPMDLALEAGIPETMPTALIVSECDGDVGPTVPLAAYAEQLSAPRTAPTLVRNLPGGTHNAVSTRLPRDKSPDCDDADLMAPDVQRAVTAALLTGFFDLALATDRPGA